MTDTASFKAIIFGKVQWVSFRLFTAGRASKLLLTGYVTNLPGGKSVEVEAEGERDQLKKLVEYLEVGPPGARVEKIDISWSEYRCKYPDFSIRY
ncbi:acylphosphatase [Chloroflexota bacterium]